MKTITITVSLNRSSVFITLKIFRFTEIVFAFASLFKNQCELLHIPGTDNSCAHALPSHSASKVCASCTERYKESHTDPRLPSGTVSYFLSASSNSQDNISELSQFFLKITLFHLVKSVCYFVLFTGRTFRFLLLCIFTLYLWQRFSLRYNYVL